MRSSARSQNCFFHKCRFLLSGARHRNWRSSSSFLGLRGTNKSTSCQAHSRIPTSPSCISHRQTMALSRCADDVLLSIASHIHHDPQPASYDIDFEARRRKFQPLVLVCRRLHAVYTPLLYRTLSLKHERNTWPAAHKPAWLQQSPERRVMDALCRTLQQVPALCLCTYFLEVRWDGHDDTAGSCLGARGGYR